MAVFSEAACKLLWWGALSFTGNGLLNRRAVETVVSVQVERATALMDWTPRSRPATEGVLGSSN